ncbi:hypothetical protein COT98_00810 [Candidatus Falkowbacteria bacterium CG10_big_fil_rev_8_21_14_0_10_39_9]|uniref:DUF4012 domain-containing protein n=1 Tax=Candidatus Falkowbacteria bacterium CG10_big_fil_rev_8_21_14_0_10_39_9 TaxID=1974566 RepID=A0A2M6WQW5_9BACT|nr:MAG: hypothetical protein COT98_00810 [Candidatus Falkowbacteria bacterium CG10_big_fil_rev_8_21_14_0_10_39_9]
MNRYLRYLILTISAALLLFVVLNFSSAMNLVKVYSISTSAKANLQKSLELLQANNFAEAAVYSGDAADSLALAFGRLEAIEGNFWVKRSNSLLTQVNDLEYMIKTAQVLAKSLSAGAIIGEKVNAVLQDKPGVSFSDLKVEDKTAVLKLIYESVPDLNGIKANLDLTLMDLKKVDNSGFFGPLQKQMTLAKDELQTGAELMSKTITLSQLLPVLAGYPNSSNYLVLLQNSDELRPTGGFLGTLGVMQTKLGDLVNFRTSDAYHLDMPASLDPNFKVASPVPIAKYLSTDRWFLRDSNWSPDWPTSAQKIQWFYDAEAKYNSDPAIKNTPKFDGVVAITPRLVTDLLYIVGPITVGGREYNKDNFTNLLQYEVEMAYRDKGVSEWDRKKVIGDILKELKTRLFALPTDRYLDLMGALNINIEKKNILFYFNDPQAQITARSLNWGGEIKSVTGDYLMLIDANLAAFKTDRVMEKNLSYSIEQKDGGAVAKVVMTYKHTGGFDWKTTRYRSYVRVYVPLGSELIKAEGISDGLVTKGEEDFGRPEAAKTYFGGFVSIEPGKSDTLSFEYRLPQAITTAIDSGTYSLYLQKQPGNNIGSLNTSLRFSNNIKNYSDNFVSVNQSTGGFFSAAEAFEADRFINVSF